MPVSPPPIPPAQPDDSYKFHNYGQYLNDFSYRYESGQLVLPIATPAPDENTASQSEIDNYRPYVAVKVHQPFTIRKQKFSATKALTPPIIPKPDSTQGDVILSHSISCPLPQPIQHQSGNGFQYSISGEYMYVERTTHTPTTGYPYAKWPITFPDQVEAAVNAGGEENANNFPVYGSNPDYTWPFIFSIGRQFFSDGLG